MPDAWSPAQYELFKDERTQPFRDLLAMVEPRPAMRVLDLGCGTGALTRELHEKLGASRTTGIDSSAAMLARAPRAEGLRFEQGRIEEASGGPYDLVFSNAALHFVGDHPVILRRIRELLASGGQLAVQLPANEEHPSHQAVYELAREPGFKLLLKGYERRPRLLEPVQYAGWLHRLGFARQRVELRVYSHQLESREAVFEWSRGGLLTDYEQRLPAKDYARFLERYRERLLVELEDERPYFYTFPRLFLWAEKAAGALEAPA